MTARIAFVFFLFLPVFASQAKSTSPLDSIGTRKEGNVTYIIHRVDQGETVYSLSKRYNISQDELIRNNPSIRDGLKIGDELKIPLKTSGITDNNNYTIHTVQPSETLFGIARQYGVSVAQIKQWNDMKGNSLTVNQKLKILKTGSAEEKETTAPSGKLHIVNQGETLYSISRMYNVSPAEIKRWNQLSSNEIQVGQELIVQNPEKGESRDKMVIANQLKIDRKNGNDNKIPAAEKPDVSAKESRPPVEIKPEKRVEKEGEFKKVVEKGMAEVIDGSETTKKYLAMHRTAPIGTIMQVKNEMNNLTVFVRVIGKLPDTGDNTNVTIRISKTAYDRLGAIDKRFPVEITYIP